MRPKFLETYRPRTLIAPEREKIKGVLDCGWCAQAKKNGKRLQIHFWDDGKITSFSNTGLIQKPFPAKIKKLLLEKFASGQTIEGEWLETAKKLYIFDNVALDGKKFFTKSYAERVALLPEIDDEDVEVLPFVTDLDTAMEIFNDPNNEGLVLRNPDRKGFEKTAIQRCRRKEFNNFGNGNANRMRGKVV